VLAHPDVSDITDRLDEAIARLQRMLVLPGLDPPAQ
jgi:hypothetical protein